MKTNNILKNFTLNIDLTMKKIIRMIRKNLYNNKKIIAHINNNNNNKRRRIMKTNYKLHNKYLINTNNIIRIWKNN